MTSTSSSFAKAVMALAEGQAEFKPAAYYDPDGDCIEFIAKDESFYAERVDDTVTVYYGHDSREIVGSLIKDVTRLCKRLSKSHPGFVMEIQDGRVRLQHLFLAQLWSSPPDKVRKVVYHKLAEAADEADAEAEVCSASA